MLSHSQAIAAVFAVQASWLEHSDGRHRWPRGAPIATPDHLILTGKDAIAIATTDANLDRALAWLPSNATGEWGAWFVADDPAAELRVRARGFRDSFTPSWMWHDLEAPSPAPHLDGDLRIVIANAAHRDAYIAADDVPYRDVTGPGRSFDRLLDIPDSVMMLAMDGMRMVGTGCLHSLPWGGQRVGGIFNLAVAPAWRRRGIGAALTVELLRAGRDMGLSGVGLNATPDGLLLYRTLGFDETGTGRRWQLPADASLPDTSTVAAAEALGRGDLGRLPADFAHRETMPDGDSPVRFAARFGQAEAIAWLLDHGAHPDIVPLWRSGMRDIAMEVMLAPATRDRLRGTPGATALHEAVLLDDGELARALIDAGADLEVRDRQWDSTPARWAQVLGRKGIAAILDEAAGPRS